MTTEKRKPLFWEALISVLALVISISVGVIKFGADPHVPLVIGTIIAAIIGYKIGYTWEELEEAMIEGITQSLQSIMILLIIGILIGLWILSGVVPTMIYYGLQILNAKIFLVASVIICAITSIGTGSSWGTVGTIGIALMGIGEGLGLPLPIVGGAIVSGAYFGDKMSPLSETTNLAPAMAGTGLYEHIKHMVYTTSVSFGIVLIIETILGFVYSSENAGAIEGVNQIINGLSAEFNISLVLLLPPILVIFLAAKKFPAIPAITMGAIFSAILGVIYQGANFGQILFASYRGYISNTGIAVLDNLLTNGGITNMLYAVSLILVAMMYGGIMENTDQLEIIVNKILQKVKSDGSLIAATLLSAIGMNLVIGEQYMTIVVTGRMYSQAYKDRGLHAKNLSRALEDSGTITGPLIPWNSCGAYMSSTLGIATIAYAPYAFFLWLTPIVSLIFGLLGITIDHIDEENKNDLKIKNNERIVSS